jgi:hypothetical protein
MRTVSGIEAVVHLNIDHLGRLVHPKRDRSAASRDDDGASSGWKNAKGGGSHLRGDHRLQ